MGAPGRTRAESLGAQVPVPVSGKFPTGWALHYALEVGDQVLTPSGGTTTVAAVSEVFAGDMYELAFSDGQTVRAEAGQFWGVSSRTTRRRDGSKVIIGNMADIDRRAYAEAKRIQDIVATLSFGTISTGNDLARISGVSAAVLLRFVRASGINSVQADVAVRPAGMALVTTTRVRFDAVAARNALRRKPVRKDASFAGRMNLDEFIAVEGALMTSLDLLVACGVDAPSARDAVSMLRILNRAGVHRVRETQKVVQHIRENVRTVEAWPLREVLTRYADHVAAGKDRAPRVRLRTTTELFAAVRVSAEDAVNWAVDLSAPLAGEHIDAILDPYLLGAWLGDGNTSSPTITCYDQPILDEISVAGYQLRARKALGHYGIIGVMNQFRALNLIGNKHIPSQYLRASFDQRLALLQGLMDTDGTVTARGTCELSLCHNRLAADALELVRSLGIKSTSNPSDASYVDKDGNRKVTSTRHRMSFTTSVPVFRLPRKLDRLPTTTRPTQALLYIIAVKKVESEKIHRISVAAADGMYLSHGFIPTHSSMPIRALIE